MKDEKYASRLFIFLQKLKFNEKKSMKTSSFVSISFAIISKYNQRKREKISDSTKLSKLLIKINIEIYAKFLQIFSFFIFFLDICNK
jgi:hypothetical protein